jgi:alpha-mannosidase
MRRQIFILTLFLFCMAGVIAQNETNNMDYTKGKTLHVIGTAHFDTQWEWTIQTSINEYVKRTMKDNFKLFEKYPDYNFSFEGAIKYMFMKEYYPEDYQRVKGYIDQGRWHVCGSSIDATDVNIPSPESVIRTILLGQNFYKREFNKKSYDIYLPDCFGFGYALPTIMNHCGLKGFSTQKLTWGAPYGIPFDIGGWQGVDGSRVFAVLNAGDYTAKLRGDITNDPKWVDIVNKTGEKSGLFVGYRYFGTGDRGGAPEDSSVFYLEKGIHANGTLKIVNAPADLLCRQITPEQLDKLPQFNGELLTSPHGSGCYTSQTAMKRWNRKNELLADAAERASVVADWFGAARYPKQKFEEAWTRFLFHQFHDDLTGTSIPEVYTFSWNDELISLKQFAGILENAAGGIAQALDTKAKGASIVVYNPLSIQREDVVEATVNLVAPAKFVKVLDKAGKEVPSQVIASEGKTLKILILAKVQPVGFEVYDVQPAEKPCIIATGLKVNNTSLENSCYKVMVNKNGFVSSVFDKRLNTELLAQPSQLQFLNDKSVTWPGWEVMYKDLISAPRCIFDNANVKVIENGPVRVAVEISGIKEGSVIKQKLMLAAGDAGNKVDFDNQINWQTKATLLKAAFPLSVSNALATYDLGMGTIARGNDKEKLYEVPAQQWADITNNDGSYGVTIMSDCKVGWDKPNDNTLRLSLIHTPATSSYHFDHSSNDLGTNNFMYSIAGHKGDWREGQSVWAAARLNQPLISFQTISHDGKLGKSFSMLSVNTNKVSVKALKLAENTDEMIVRVQELTGSETKDVVLSLPVNIISAKEVNGAEEYLKDLTIKDGKLVFDLKGYQPKAFAIKIDKAPVALATKTSLPLPLAFDIDGVSFDNNRADGNFDGNGTSFPAELLPNEIVSEDVHFKLGSSADGQKNFLASNGNLINLPSGKYNTVYILAAALTDTKGVFKIDGNPFEIEVPSFTGKIGQWDNRLNIEKLSHGILVNGKNFSSPVELDPAFVKRTPLAWVGTHSHDGKLNSNRAYEFCYLYKLAIDLPKGAKVLSLPDNTAIRIAAISLSNDLNKETKPVQDLYDRLERMPRLTISSDCDGVFSSEAIFEIKSANAKDAIYYTLDGSIPSEKSTKYEKPVKITDNALISAIAFQNGKQSSVLTSTSIFKMNYLAPTEVNGLNQGLQYKYYEDNSESAHWNELPDFTKLPVVKSGTINTFVLPDCKREDYFGVCYEGYINIPEDGFYTFYVNSDDGSKLMIDGQTIVSNDGNHGAIEIGGKSALKKGFHKINVQYFEGTLSNILEVSIEGKGISKQQIPANMLFRQF